MRELLLLHMPYVAIYCFLSDFMLFLSLLICSMGFLLTCYYYYYSCFFFHISTSRIYYLQKNNFLAMIRMLLAVLMLAVLRMELILLVLMENFISYWLRKHILGRYLWVDIIHHRYFFGCISSCCWFLWLCLYFINDLAGVSLIASLKYYVLESQNQVHQKWLLLRIKKWEKCLTK